MIYNLSSDNFLSLTFILTSAMPVPDINSTTEEYNAWIIANQEELLEEYGEKE